tara:strand:- start:3297 stop:4082 length:786 start_codon:yes stop_codon:yes gene_type:complete
MSQTTVNLEQPVGVVGSLSDNGNRDAGTFLATEKTPFGQLANRVAGSDSTCQLPTQATDITLLNQLAGVAIADQARESKLDSLSPGYEIADAVSCLRKGRIYVLVENAVTPSSTVYARFAGRPQITEQLWDGDFVEANVINGKVNGNAIAAVTFATTPVATITALAASIQAHPDVATATADTNTVTVTAVTDKEVSLTDFVVTLGDGQVTPGNTVTQTLISSADRGKFRSDNNGGLAAAVPNAKFRSSAAANGLAVLELDL